MSIDFLDQRALLARQASADRVWGGPKFERVDTLLQHAAAIGDLPSE